jgi:hypothetical protein
MNHALFLSLLELDPRLVILEWFHSESDVRLLLYKISVSNQYAECELISGQWLGNEKAIGWRRLSNKPKEEPTHLGPNWT